MIKINIERLMDVVEEENSSYFDYCYHSKNLYKGDFKEWDKRKKCISYFNQCHDRAQSAVMAVMEIFCMDAEQQKRVYICARAVRRWRIRTNYEFFIPESMQEQMRQFIFA